MREEERGMRDQGISLYTVKITAKHEPTDTAHAYFKVHALLGKKCGENLVRLKIQYISALNEPKRHL